MYHRLPVRIEIDLSLPSPVETKSVSRVKTFDLWGFLLGTSCQLLDVTVDCCTSGYLWIAPQVTCGLHLRLPVDYTSGYLWRLHFSSASPLEDGPVSGPRGLVGGGGKAGNSHLFS